MDTNLVELMQKFNSEDRCREYVEALRWPSGVCCTRCGSLSVSRIVKRHQYDCNDCRYQFSPMAGTVFHDTHLPLTKWFLATYLMCESKKGMSANQLKRTLGISYKTAWYLCHRIREAMKSDTSEKLKGIVEADETFVGGKYDRRRIGSFHKVSEKHLDRYLDEFTYRFNGREDDRLFQNTLRNLVNGETLTFEKLTQTA